MQINREKSKKKKCSVCDNPDKNLQCPLSIFSKILSFYFSDTFLLPVVKQAHFLVKILEWISNNHRTKTMFRKLCCRARTWVLHGSEWSRHEPDKIMFCDLQPNPNPTFSTRTRPETEVLQHETRPKSEIKEK